MTFHSTGLPTGSVSWARGSELVLTPLTFIFTGDLWGSSSTSSVLPSLEPSGEERKTSQKSVYTHGGGTTQEKKVNKRRRGGAGASTGRGMGRSPRRVPGTRERSGAARAPPAGARSAPDFAAALRAAPASIATFDPKKSSTRSRAPIAREEDGGAPCGADRSPR